MLDADTNAAAALQAGVDANGTPVFDHVEGSEDCLYLNVFAPADPGPHPVLCWIHGGGGLSGSPFECDGVAFAEEGIVVVAIAYRLGLLGLLSVPSLFGREPSSNLALLDQIEALRWVRENIAAFGGDPERVTVVGQSNGARATVNLLGAPASRGLFQQAVIMSSTGGGLLVSTQDEARDLLVRVLAELGVDSGAAEQLRTADAEELVRVQTEMWLRSPVLLPFLCVIDGAVLPERPYEAVAGGSARGVRLLIGTTRDECNGFALAANQSFQAFAQPRSMVVSEETLGRLVEAYRSLGYQGSEAELLLRVLTASEYWIPAIRLAEAQARAGGEVWMYRFDFGLSPDGQPPGATHGADISAVCAMSERQSNNLRRFDTDVEALLDVTGTLRDAFIRFVRGESPGQVEWPQYDPDSRATYVFDAESKVAFDPDHNAREAWTGVL